MPFKKKWGPSSNQVAGPEALSWRAQRAGEEGPRGAPERPPGCRKILQNSYQIEAIWCIFSLVLINILKVESKISF